MSAKEKAEEKLQTIFSGLEDQMSEAQKDGDASTSPPWPRKNGIESGKTKLIVERGGVERYDIGKDADRRSAFVRSWGSNRCCGSRCNRGTRSSRLLICFGLSGRRGSDSEFSDKGVRAEVLLRWKLDHARQAALAAAENGGRGPPLGEDAEGSFADRPDIRVTETSRSVG